MLIALLDANQFAECNLMRVWYLLFDDRVKQLFWLNYFLEQTIRLENSKYGLDVKKTFQIHNKMCKSKLFWAYCQIIVAKFGVDWSTVKQSTVYGLPLLEKASWKLQADMAICTTGLYKAVVSVLSIVVVVAGTTLVTAK